MQIWVSDNQPFGYIGKFTKSRWTLIKSFIVLLFIVCVLLLLYFNIFFLKYFVHLEPGSSPADKKGPGQKMSHNPEWSTQHWKVIRTIYFAKTFYLFVTVDVSFLLCPSYNLIITLKSWDITGPNSTFLLLHPSFTQHNLSAKSCLKSLSSIFPFVLNSAAVLCSLCSTNIQSGG